MVLDRNRLIANSSEKNPLVKDLASSLQSIQNTIIQSVDNHIVSLNTQIRNIKQQEVVTTQQLASNPNQAKYLLSVERQQKVKEELYLYLLQKREENELSQAFTAYNTRVITAPRGSAFPTAPKKMNIALVAFCIRIAHSCRYHLHEGEHEYQSARSQGLGKSEYSPDWGNTYVPKW